jgi:uncharacterized protein
MDRAALLVLCGTLAAGATCRPADADADAAPGPDAGALPVGIVEVETPSGDWLRLRVELATTAESQARGLMFREHLEDGEGMLFVFAGDTVRSFWMKNTLIPLDMIFIDAAGIVVGVVHEAEPLTTSPRSVGRPSRYVLEVPGGWARARGVEAGTRVRFPGAGGVAPFGGETGGGAPAGG